MPVTGSTVVSDNDFPIFVDFKYFLSIAPVRLVPYLFCAQTIGSQAVSQNF